MTYNKISGSLSGLAARVILSSRLIALTMIVALATLAVQPAHAQSANTWKSIAIIGGTTAAGAYIGHRVGGGKGALIGTGVGATTGYVIDRHRRANQYYNESAYRDGYSNDGYNGYQGAESSEYRNNDYSGNAYRQNYSQGR